MFAMFEELLPIFKLYISFLLMLKTILDILLKKSVDKDEL